MKIRARIKQTASDSPAPGYGTGYGLCGCHNYDCDAGLYSHHSCLSCYPCALGEMVISSHTRASDCGHDGTLAAETSSGKWNAVDKCRSRLGEVYRDVEGNVPFFLLDQNLGLYHHHYRQQRQHWRRLQVRDRYFGPEREP